MSAFKSGNKRKRRSGVAIVEFSLSLIFLTPLLLGLLVFGFRITKDIQMQQVVRDLGHMYLRGANFRDSAMLTVAQTLARGLDLTSSGKSGIVVSKIRLIMQADCDAADTTHIGTKCANRDQGAFVEQIKLGNSSIASSVFGTPPLDGNYNVTSSNQALNSSAQANGFASILPMGVGEYAYVVEMFNQTPDLSIPGFSGQPQVYARSIF
jgi:hypothetical protein